ncbi:MAG: glycosyltransferase, partial [Bacteroidetes bacterium]|nr:glycosyltransferase [Bacteroidota bacterium]
MIYPPEISVVLPVYNGEKHIKNCILSILNQSFKNFELIIINDGSTDQTVSLISSFSDDRLKLVTQENTGIGGALRRGCNVAVGKYILRIDADDICLPNRFIVQKHFLDSRPNVVMLGGASIYVDEEGLEIGRSYPYTSNFILKSMLIKYSPFCHPTVIFRKNAYIEAGGYQALEPLEDVDLWLKLSKLGEIKNLCSPVIKNTIVGNSISRSISIK